MKALLIVLNDEYDSLNPCNIVVVIEDNSRSDEVFEIFSNSNDAEKEENEEYTNESIFDRFFKELDKRRIKLVDMETSERNFYY